MTGKKWFWWGIILTLLALILIAGITIVIDPFFHYHRPIEGLSYMFTNQRYQNDGIIRHFEYDAIITGTSMTENFKKTEFDELFKANSVKVPFSGGSYKEIGDMVCRAIKYNENIQYVIRGLDYNRLLDDKDTMRYENYPEYLYDDNIWNDVNYWFNKDIFFRNTARVIYQTVIGKRGDLDFDAAYNWSDLDTYGKEAVDESYQRPDNTDERYFLEEDDIERMKANLTQNVISLAINNPEIEFYLFFPPYSIYYWDSYQRSGRLDYQLEAEKIAIEFLLPYENIFLFSFTDNFELITCLDNYKDIAHYGGWVNSQILSWMKEGKYQLTKDNYLDYCKREQEYLKQYDYDGLFQ